MSNHQIDLRAYAIPLLHAAKYPAYDVCGALLGKIGTKDQHHTEITTAVPFFHQWTTVTPMLEVALKQTEMYAKKHGWVIVGWYYGKACLNDSAIPESAKKVAEAIKNNNGGKAYVFMIDNEQFSASEPNKSVIIMFLDAKLTKFLKPYIAADNGWKKLAEDQIILTETNTYAKTLELINKSLYTDIHDFDEHLNNVSLNWLDVSQLRLI
ncbi:hypothetical protein BDF20DRAFT_837470 [Mycotypha africana]|uniref:uncharacterized protein n=1 Tax=Mycotypha africana TaxID=64632 RepID=UPI0023003810|nr:uncharacterized protein BDF20DRAFT_837470 [Mycotypha africana]KAI8973533.1 hypothetical protein BDF20DRAFT_837470 [Mycotypha africana]